MVVNNNIDNEILRKIHIKLVKKEECCDFCKDCKLYPCPDCDDDTITIDCDYKEKEEPELNASDKGIPRT